MSFTGMVQTVSIVRAKYIFVAFGVNRLPAFSHSGPPDLRTNGLKALNILQYYIIPQCGCVNFFFRTAGSPNDDRQDQWDSACLDVYIFIKP